VKRNPASALLVSGISFYRRAYSEARPRRCRYEPTCSAYAEQAIRELGPIRGGVVAAWRVLRCHPFSRGGIDPLEDRRMFRA
jgi:putative membrane protein insertion efficiency factor